MRCLACDAPDTRVVDSRTAGDTVRRRRECQVCGERFTTHERVERRTVWVVKKDGRKEPFDRDKVLHGLALACRKRPVSVAQLDDLARQVEFTVEGRRDADVTAKEVGATVMGFLRSLDEVAYVRFASVYQEFESVEQFVDAIRPLRERA